MSSTKEQRIRQAHRLRGQNFTRDQIAERMGKSRSTIDKYLADSASTGAQHTASASGRSQAAKAGATQTARVDLGKVAEARDNATRAFGWLTRSHGDMQVVLTANNLTYRPAGETEAEKDRRLAMGVATRSLRTAVVAMEYAQKTTENYDKFGTQSMTGISRRELREKIDKSIDELACAREIIEHELNNRDPDNWSKLDWLQEAYQSIKSAAVTANAVSSSVHLMLGTNPDDDTENAASEDTTDTPADSVDAMSHSGDDTELAIRDAAADKAAAAVRAFDQWNGLADDSMVEHLSTMRSLRATGTDYPGSDGWEQLAERIAPDVRDYLKYVEGQSQPMNRAAASLAHRMVTARIMAILHDSA